MHVWKSHFERYLRVALSRLLVACLPLLMATFTMTFLMTSSVTMFAVTRLQAAGLQDSLDVVTTTNRDAAKSQQQIDKTTLQKQALLEEYRRLRNSADYQAAYTLELQQLELAQQARIEALRQEIEAARITQQQIVPLMRAMANALEKFVVLDLPFHHEERIAAVLKLNQRLRQPALSLSAKFRLLLEAYQLEQDYGGTIEAWRGTLVQDDEPLSVEYLRIGRVALYYQSLDGRGSAYWDAAGQDWVPLAAEFNRGIAEALRVARNQLAPRLLTLPMSSPVTLPLETAGGVP